MSSLQGLGTDDDTDPQNGDGQGFLNAGQPGVQNTGTVAAVNNQIATQQDQSSAHTPINLYGMAQNFGQTLNNMSSDADQARIAANHDAQVAKIQAAAQQEQLYQSQVALQNQQAANAQTRTTLLGQIADPSSTAAVQNVDQQALNTQNSLASATSTNAYQSGDLAQTGLQTSGMSTGATGQSAIDEQQAGAQARADALTQLGQLDDATTGQDLQIAQTDVARQQGEIQNAFQQLTNQSSNLDAQQKQQLTQYGNQLNYYMQQYQLAVNQGEAGRASALGWLKLGIGVLATAGAAVATVATAGAASPALVAAGAYDASLAH